MGGAGGQVGPQHCFWLQSLRESLLTLVASGLLWLAELIEEHSRYAKTIGMRGIYVSFLPLQLGV